MPAPPDAHEWVSFEDPDEDRTWVFDVTFLSSPWRCIFGQGCQGVLTGPAPELEQGCCSYGAHFSGEEDVARVEEAAATLQPGQWQLARVAARRGGPLRRARGGPVTTRIVDGACVFLNRPGFPGGAGCALHRAALERSIEPLLLKPDVCWQLPLRREDDTDASGHVTSTVSQWERRHWGPAGDDFHWWCSEAPEAFTNPEPVHRSLRSELRALVGDRALEMVEAYLDDASRSWTPLPHPALRRR